MRNISDNGNRQAGTLEFEGYEIPYIIKQAIEEYGATRETLSDVLRDDVEYEGPTGLNKFDEHGDVTEKMQMVFVVHDGKFTSWVP